MKNFYTAVAIASIVLIHPSTNLLCQEKLSLTIENAIEIGLEHSKSLHSSLMKVEAADARAGEVRAAGLPALKLGGSYTRVSDVPPFEIGPFPPVLNNRVTISPVLLDNYIVKLSLQQPLFTGFRLQSNAAIANYTALASEQDYTKDKSELVYSIKLAYWNLYKAAEIKKVIDENIEQMNAHRKDVQNLFSQGIVTKNEVLKVEVQLSNTQLMQLDAGNNVQLATIALNNAMGVSLTTPVEITSSIKPESKEYGDLNVLIQKAVHDRPEVYATDLRVKASESAVTVAQSGWFPQIFLSGNYYYARPNSRIFPTIDQFRNTWDVGVSVAVDLWNWGATVDQTRQASAQLEQAKDALAQLRDGIALEVTQSFLNNNQARARIGVAAKGVEQAEENYRITNQKFKEGLALNADLLDAQVALLQARWNHIQSLVDQELADSRLQKAIGAGLPPNH